MARIGVYAIALNEEEFIERWATSAAEADVILMADTGSTDRTVEIARSIGVQVVTANIVPWRFDMARNVALSSLPADLDWCIALDLDEVLVPGWRPILDEAPLTATRPNYLYTWSWNPDGSPGFQYLGDKIHARAGYRWVGPVHEICTPYGSQVDIQSQISMEIHHFPDSTKSRGSYLPLLAMAVAENPTDTRRSFWYARDLMFSGSYSEAVAEFHRFLTIPGAWNVERSWAMRYLAALIPQQRGDYLLAATAEAPERREPWMELAEFHYAGEEWAQAIMAAEHALAITHNPVDYLTESSVWGNRPQEIIRKARQWLKIEENL